MWRQTTNNIQAAARRACPSWPRPRVSAPAGLAGRVACCRARLSTSTRHLHQQPQTPQVAATAGGALHLRPYLNFKAMAQPEMAAKIAANIQHRNLPSIISIAAVNQLYQQVSELTFQIDKTRAERNSIAAEMKSLSHQQGALKKNKNKNKPSLATISDADAQASTIMTMEQIDAKRKELVERGKAVKENLHVQEAKLSELEQQLYEQGCLIPNMTHPTSPIGSEANAQLVRIHGVPRLNKNVRAIAHPAFPTIFSSDPPSSATTTIHEDIAKKSSAGSVELGGEDARALLGNVSEYPLLDHVALAHHLDLVDFEAAAQATGARWYYLKNEAALLELALIQFATARAVQAGFTPVITPDVVRPEVVQACGFQPRDEASQTYWVSTVAPTSSSTSNADTPASSSSQQQQQHHHSHSALCLVATAEIALAGLNMNKVLDESQLPMRLAGFGRAFRAEAGARGAENKGLYRVHQFSKVELFVYSRAGNESDALLEEIRHFQEKIFEELGLCFRVLDMPTEELGASAYKKYDIEAWMPGRNSWGEISSTSNCTDYQSRRLNIRYRNKANNNATEFVHTLNGTAMAVPRIIVALLETYQQQDGSVRLPECLVPYMHGIKEIRPRIPLPDKQ
ncbi:seryl-tRNA synthetase [Actinomortierella ambigua]|nr:seryl-tRNA synthetase [Actinomortierella ambigua]